MSTLKRGRPPLSPDQPSTNVTVALPVGEYDHVYAEAQRERVTIPEWIRRLIARNKKIQNRQADQ